ncbi:MAG TPA: hypothetical protein VFI73_14255 [Candidatus Nitrosopolaris sp.]|nr:hypothetical protein [Candidatus Nitrosopolaris sp.]
MRLLRRNGEGKKRKLADDGIVTENKELQYSEKENSNNPARAKNSTENLLRMIWELVVWPLILENERMYFTIEEYRAKIAELCAIYEIQPLKLSGLLIAIVAKGLLTKRGDTYSIHPRHMPYMEKKISLGYGRAVKEVYTME